MSHYPEPGCYGKLPGSGDFLRRRLPDSLVNNWARWFQSSLLQQESVLSPAQLARAPVWNFIVPAPLGNQLIQMGCLILTQDRVGRQYPLCAMQLVTPEEWHPLRLKTAGNWYYALGRTLSTAVRNRHSAEQLDSSLLALSAAPEPDDSDRSDILDVIGYQDTPCTLNWPQLESYFDPTQYTSFWWTNQSDGSAFATYTCSGNFTTQLFTRLFKPTQSEHHGRYPPLFE